MLVELAVIKRLTGGLVKDGKGPRQAAAQAETENAGYVLEQVREATGLPEGGADVEARDSVRWATGSSVGARGGGTLGG